jgi:hypothetical protein
MAWQSIDHLKHGQPLLMASKCMCGLAIDAAGPGFTTQQLRCLLYVYGRSRVHVVFIIIASDTQHVQCAYVTSRVRVQSSNPLAFLQPDAHAPWHAGQAYHIGMHFNEWTYPDLDGHHPQSPIHALVASRPAGASIGHRARGWTTLRNPYCLPAILIN